MNFSIGDTVVVKLDNISLVGSSQQEYIKEMYLGTPLTGKVVYIKEDKNRLGIQFDWRIYIGSFKYTKGYKGMFNAYGRGPNGHCAYVNAAYVDSDKTKAEPTVVQANNIPDFMDQVRQVATYYGRAIENESPIFSGNLIRAKMNELGFALSYDPYNPSGLLQSKEERNAIKAAMFGQRYGMEGTLGVTLIRPRRIGLTYAQQVMMKEIESYMGTNNTRIVCSNDLTFEPVDWEEPLSLDEISILGSSYQADQMRSEYKGWRHSFNQESQRGKNIWMNPKAYFDSLMGTFKPDYSDAVMASSWAAMATLHPELTLPTELQPYGDEEVLLCHS